MCGEQRNGCGRFDRLTVGSHSNRNSHEPAVQRFRNWKWVPAEFLLQVFERVVERDHVVPLVIGATQASDSDDLDRIAAPLVGAAGSPASTNTRRIRRADIARK